MIDFQNPGLVVVPPHADLELTPRRCRSVSCRGRDRFASDVSRRRHEQNLHDFRFEGGQTFVRNEGGESIPSVETSGNNQVCKIRMVLFNIFLYLLCV